LPPLFRLHHICGGGYGDGGSHGEGDDGEDGGGDGRCMSMSVTFSTVKKEIIGGLIAPYTAIILQW
jgi:hypothetical protein